MIPSIARSYPLRIRGSIQKGSVEKQLLTQVFVTGCHATLPKHFRLEAYSEIHSAEQFALPQSREIHETVLLIVEARLRSRSRERVDIGKLDALIVSQKQA